MMHLKYAKKFVKNFGRRIENNAKLKKQFQQRLEVFLRDPRNNLLKNHKLTGAKKDLSAFSVTGDVRVLYYQKEDVIYLVDIGTHNQVY